MSCSFLPRALRPSDLAACLDLHPAKKGTEFVGWDRALAAWRKIHFETPASTSVVIEREDVRRIVAFASAVFVTAEFAERELIQPQPGLNARIIGKVCAGEPVLASYREIATGNARAELQQVILYSSWRREGLSTEEQDKARQVMAQTYYQNHAGYRVSRIMTELVDAVDLAHVSEFRAFPVVSRYEEYFALNPDSWNRDRGLAVATKDTIYRDPGSAFTAAFSQRSPVLNLSRVDQELLAAALEEMDDADLARRLHLSQAAIKRRWERLFERVSDAMPDLCPPSEGNVRGLQKRHRILAYVREHREELRPFDALSAGAGRGIESLSQESSRR